jgi:hypothetical protein
VKSGVKEETMKKFICIAVAFMLMLIFIGCSATMTPEQRKELYQERQGGGSGLSSTVGESLLVGSTKPQPGTVRYHEMFGY